MKSTVEAVYFIKDLKEEPAPHFDAGFFRQAKPSTEQSMKLILPIVLIAFVSCVSTDPNEQVDLGKVADDRYHCAEIGWSMRIPEGWEIMSRDEKQAMNDRGLEALSDGTGINLDSLKNLIAFRRGPYSSFLSTIERFEETYEGEYAENAKALNVFVYETLTGQGIQVDTSSAMETIHGKEFFVFNTAIHGPDGTVIARQRAYGRLVNGYDHGATLTYANEADRDTLMSVWGSSVFDMQQTAMKSTGEAIYFVKDLKEKPAPHFDAGFFRQVYGERSMYLSR